MLIYEYAAKARLGAGARHPKAKAACRVVVTPFCGAPTEA